MVALPVARAGAMQVVLLGRASSPLTLGGGGGGGGGAGGGGDGDGAGAGGGGDGDGAGAGGGGDGDGAGAGGGGDGDGAGAGGGALCEASCGSPSLPLLQPVNTINMATASPRPIGATKVVPRLKMTG
jgi:hypothetical protein